jgi:methylated-DNA-[protein]-cysteine S-methyltransferase
VHLSNRHAVVDTAIGELTVVASAYAIVGVYFPHHWHRPSAATLGGRVDLDSDELLATAAAQLATYLAGNRRDFELPTATSGDVFQERVWALLRAIPYGEVTTYGELAEHLGGLSLARSVGRATGQNPLSILVPCHRVVGKDGGLTGYAGGLGRKRFLLELEQAPAPIAGRLF